MNTFGRGDPEVERVIAEVNALNAAIAADSPALAREARGMVREAEAKWPETGTFSGFIIRAAMSRITGSTPPTGEPTRTSGEDTEWAVRAFELVGLAWLAWSRGENPRARFWISQWTRESATQTNLSEEGAVQAFTVGLWANAIEALIEDRTLDAQRFFRRVHDVGSSYGTESHPTILWTMAASFFSQEG